MNLEARLEYIRHKLLPDPHVYSATLAARECLLIIELALRELLLRQLPVLTAADQQKINALIAKSAKGGRGNSIADFTLGQLIGILRDGNFFDAYSRATNRQVVEVRMLDLNQLTHFRNERLIHLNSLDELKNPDNQVTQDTANMLFNYTCQLLTTFDIVSLDNPPTSLLPSTPSSFRLSGVFSGLAALGQALSTSWQTNLNSIIGMMSLFGISLSFLEITFLQGWLMIIGLVLLIILVLIFRHRTATQIQRPTQQNTPALPSQTRTTQAIRLRDDENCLYYLLKRKIQNDEICDLGMGNMPQSRLCLIQGHKQQAIRELLCCLLPKYLEKRCDTHILLHDVKLRDSNQVKRRLLREIAESLGIERAELPKLLPQLTQPAKHPIILHIQLNQRECRNIAALLKDSLIPFTQEWTLLSDSMRKPAILLFVSVLYDRDGWWQRSTQTKLIGQAKKLKCHTLSPLAMIQVEDVLESWLEHDFQPALQNKHKIYARYYQQRQQDIRNAIKELFHQRKRYPAGELIPKLIAIMENRV